MSKLYLPDNEQNIVGAIDLIRFDVVRLMQFMFQGTTLVVSAGHNIFNVPHQNLDMFSLSSSFRPHKPCKIK